MKYYCEKCKGSYTIPVGDKLIEKNDICKCGEKAKNFQITDNIIFFKFPENMMLIRG